MEKDDVRFLSAQEAESLLNEGERIHTFRNPAGGIMLGCDWDRSDVLELFKKYDGKIQIGGNSCRAMDHAIVVWDKGPLFIENNKEALDKLDPIT